MSNLMFWRMDGTGLANVDNNSVGDTSAAASGPATISATAAKYGSNGLLAEAVGADARYQFTITADDLMPRSEGAMGVWIQWKTSIPNDSTFAVMRNSPNDNAIRLNSKSTGNANLQITSGGSTVDHATTGNKLVADNWYFILGRWNQPNNWRRLEIFNTSMTLIDLLEDTSTAYSAPVGPITFASGLRLGIMDSITQTNWLDNFFLDNDYEAPIHRNATITSWTAWDGTAADLPQLQVIDQPSLIRTIFRSIGP